MHHIERPFGVAPLRHCTRQARIGAIDRLEPISQEKANASKLEHNSRRPAAVTAKNPSDTKS